MITNHEPVRHRVYLPNLSSLRSREMELHMLQSKFVRRRFLTYFSGLGLSSTLLPGVLWARLQEEETPKITADMLKEFKKKYKMK